MEAFKLLELGKGFYGVKRKKINFSFYDKLSLWILSGNNFLGHSFSSCSLISHHYLYTSVLLWHYFLLILFTFAFSCKFYFSGTLVTEIDFSFLEYRQYRKISNDYPLQYLLSSSPTFPEFWKLHGIAEKKSVMGTK